MTRVIVQSDLFQNRVGKIAYQIRRSFRIIESTGHGDYIVQTNYI